MYNEPLFINSNCDMLSKTVNVLRNVTLLMTRYGHIYAQEGVLGLERYGRKKPLVTPLRTMSTKTFIHKTFRSLLDYSKSINFTGAELLRDSEHNKGLAFTNEERIKYKLRGLVSLVNTLIYCTF